MPVKALRLAAAAMLALTAGTPAAAQVASPPTLDDLFSDADTRDAAISPSGRYLAVVVRQEPNDVIVVQDLDTGERIVPTSINRTGAGERFQTRMSHVYWKNDERLLFRVQVRPKPGAKVENLTKGNFTKLGDRLFAINRDGTKAVRLLGDNRDWTLDGALNLGAIASMMPRDRDHVMMFVHGFLGPALYRVDVNSGAGTIIEHAAQDVAGWWPDVDGNPVVRVERSLGTIRFQRKQDGKWKEFHRVAVKEMQRRPEYEPVGASADAGKYYVIARPPGRERRGVYLYDLTQEDFGEPLVEHPTFDLTSAQVSRDGKGLMSHCHVEHVRICDLTDARANAHMKGLRKYFQQSANVHLTDISLDSNTLVLFVEGPSVPPSFHYYRVSTKKIEFIGLQRNSLFDKKLPVASVVSWKARDGREISGYLSRPAGSENARRLPLVIHPHGGPEMRDQLSFDRWVQHLTSLGYAVFQPNFRGSDGFGRAFAESGHGQWGRSMQDDISDGLAALVQQEIIDPQRVCVVGASYGGYAALAGAALTPDLYKCAVSIAGVSDLSAFVKWYKFEHGPDSAGLAYWHRLIGDPERSLHSLRAVSPVHHADAIKADVLLIHGEKDDVVPLSQSKAMKRALDNSSRKITLMEIEDEGHSYWSEENERLALEKIAAFLAKNLGPGFGAAPPSEVKHEK
jgi:dipeptidyl aminopeptidase/acylaminoacyl peptidase